MNKSENFRSRIISLLVILAAILGEFGSHTHTDWDAIDWVIVGVASLILIEWGWSKWHDRS